MMDGCGRHYGENENLTLTDADLAATGKRPVATKGGEAMRYPCPVHGSDHQRSLELNTKTGRFFCHACRCWGYMDWAREEYRRERGLDNREGEYRPTRTRRVVQKPPPPPPIEPVRDDLDELLARYQEALPGSWGEKYLQHRGVSLELAQQYGIGYAAPKEWVGRDWKGGRLVFPHHRPDGRLVNLYGRAVAKGTVPKERKHDHLGGNKGWFNARVLAEGHGPLCVCEAGLDALALIAAGCTRAVAIYGTYGWRWDWIPKDVREIVIAADADEGGDKVRETIGVEARLRGIRVAYLDAESYGGEKDTAAAYAAGVLKVGEFPAAHVPTEGDGRGVELKRRDYREEAEAAIVAAQQEREVDTQLTPSTRAEGCEQTLPKPVPSPSTAKGAPSAKADGDSSASDQVSDLQKRIRRRRDERRRTQEEGEA